MISDARAGRSDPPMVSVLIPALQEASHLDACLTSLLSSPCERLVEVLVVDGGSTDGTQALAAAYGPPVRVVDNPRRSPAAAMNVGLAQAQGDVIIRADAHSTYGPDYLALSVRALQETGADNVGGPMRPVATTPFGRAVSAVMQTPGAVGPGRPGAHDPRRETDTVPFGCWWRSTLEDLGGFDERLVGAEDDELNLRLTARGGRVVCDPELRFTYRPRQTVAGLARQYAGYGRGKARVLVKHRVLPTPRPVAPAVLVAGSLLLGVGGAGAWRAGLPLLHLVYAARVGRQAAADRDDVASSHCTLATLVCHWSYGVGFWRGLAAELRDRVQR